MKSQQEKSDKEFKPSKEFNIVFVTNKRHVFGRYKRQLISVSSLEKLIGKDNVDTALKSAFESEDDKFEKKFRKHGRVIFYNK